MASKAGKPARGSRVVDMPAIEPAAVPMTEPVIALPEPVIEQVIDPVADQPTIEEPAVDQPVFEQPEAVAMLAAPIEEPIMDATTTIDQTKTIFAEATDRTKTAYAKGQQMVGEIGEFSKGNVEAIVESSKIAAKGLEQFGQSAAAYVRSSFEEAQSQARTLASAGSPTEFMKLQGDFARTAFDRMVAEASKNTEAMLKLAGEVAQPISNRLALAADRMKVAA